MMIGVAIVTLSTAANQLSVGQRGAIRIVMAYSLLILVNIRQVGLKGGKQ